MCLHYDDGLRAFRNACVLFSIACSMRTKAMLSPFVYSRLCMALRLVAMSISRLSIDITQTATKSIHSTRRWSISC